MLQEIAEVTYLPLETQDDFLVSGSIGYMDMGQIILNNRNQLFFFDRNSGSPSGILNRKGNSGKEYNRIDAFVFDKNAGEIFIANSNRKEILVYDLNQQFIRSFETMDYQQMVDYDSQTLLVYRQQKDSTSTPFFLISKDNGEVIQELDIVSGPRLDGFSVQLPNGSSATAHISGKSGSLTSTKNDVLISEWSCDTMYRFDYRGALVPVAVRKPTAEKMEPRWLLHLSGENKLFFMFTATCIKGFTPGMVLDIEYRYIAYDKQEQKLVTPRFVNTDDPTGSVWKGKSLDQFGTDLVVSLSADRLYTAYEEGKLRGRLQEIASTLKEDDNPVLMLVKCK